MSTYPRELRLKMFRVLSMGEINVGLCRGRHVLHTNEGKVMDAFIFDAPIELPVATDVHEKVCREFIADYMQDFKGMTQHRRFNLYVTGLTPLLTSFLKLWVERQEMLEMGYADLVLWHWNRETEQYVPQKWAVIT